MGDRDRKIVSPKDSVLPHRRLRSDFDGKIAGLYDLEETIGEGHFAVVKLARHVFTGEKVAVKVIDKTKLDEVSKAHLFQEVRCMKLVQHPNVVRLYEVIDTQTKLYLILELGDGGDMYDYIMKHEKGLDELKARHYFRQIVEAISYCHKLHVVHRDLKPENVVFFKKLELVKLTDFGFSNMFNPGNKLETSCGSLAYSAPEILLGDSYDAQAVDIWSLGVILYMLVCGEPPFQEANDSETLTMIMDCKYKFPPHVSQSCQQLISLMLRREPGHRANLNEIEVHEWLSHGAEDVQHFHMPLISREQVSEEDHVHVIEKMVDGCIGTKEEILTSLEKDMYNHVTATYYLLAERRLRKHRQDLINQANLSRLRKHSAPPTHSKPHLEPLALSPRKQRELKKTKTAPVSANVNLLVIPESPGTEDYGQGPDMKSNCYFKSLTDSQTLDRRQMKKNKKSNQPSSPLTARTIPLLSVNQADAKKPVPVVKEPVVKAKKPKGFTKIAILSNYFEQKIALLASSASQHRWYQRSRKKKERVKQRGLQLSERTSLDTPDNPALDLGVMSKDAESADDKKSTPKQQGLMMSLLSPQGIHPTPSSSLRNSPTDSLTMKARKCSLIKEESLDEVSDEEMDEEFEHFAEKVRFSKSAENLDVDYDDDYSQNASMSPRSDRNEPEEKLLMKRPLLSVASSPQLLNQICEENESEEEDDFMPLSSSTRLISQRNSVASPELIRKYEARKKRRGAGSRGTSCSSSDASDTDDTEGRSRKDKLKHKFAHRRDSSDHSSDTDGAGPSGPGGGGGLGKGLGGSSSGGGGPGRDNDGGGSGGGGKKEGKGGGSPRSGREHGRGKQNNLALKLSGSVMTRHSHSKDPNLLSGVLNLSLSSLNSKSSLKYVLERDENVSDSDAEDNADVENEEEVRVKNKLTSHVERLNHENKSNNLNQCDFSNLSKQTELIIPKSCNSTQLKKGHGGLMVKKDINSNMYCNGKGTGPGTEVKIETKCCSVV